MATVQLGKLKFRFKDGGLDYRWGDGEIKRIGKKSGQGAADDYADQYDEYDEDENLNYGGRFADEEDYPDEDYPDEDYADNYADDGAYADDGYDDSYADDGYDDGYDEDGYDDYDPEYDDRYSDEDADDGYGEEEYEPYDDGYDGGYDDGYDGGYDDGEQENSLLQYVDDNDWVTYLLLVLLPPLGIYLLWRRQRFEPVIRYSIMAASAVWFVVMIILLITLLTSGHQEITGDPQLPTLQPTVETTATPVPSVSPSATANNASALTAPSATPIGGGAAATLAQGSIVWASSSGNFYHKDQTCQMASGQTLAQTTIENAKNRGKYACPTCYGGDLYYATAGGDYYHLDKDCSSMDDAEMYSLEKAKAEKKEACPVCVTKTQKTLTVTKENENLTFVTSSTKDKSGVKVWCTTGGVNYHMTSSCRGMKGAKQVSLSEALLMGKTACDTCCEVSGEMVYCTKPGTYYHRNSTCSGMKNASKVTIAEAMVIGKKECPTCRPVANSSSSGSSGSSSSGSSGSSGSSSSGSSGSAEEYYVYANKGGKYYHVKRNCSGMTGASKVTLKSMIAEGRPACPECCGGAGMSVYATKGGTYYHSYATCSGMNNASAGTLSAALAAGYKRCPRCWGESGSTTSGSSSSGSSAATATSDTVKVYATTGGKYYHTKSNCTGMKNARYITLTQAMNEGKTACSTCAATASKTVYSTSGGKYYHKASTCEHMDNGKKRTLAEALKMGQTACPVCMTGSSDKSESTTTPSKVANFSVGTSGIKVYASTSHTYYHIKSSCSKAVSGLSQVALETALNYGRKACPTCCATASESVYATKNGKYYHVSKSCAGSGAAKGTLANALAYGFSPCPYCVSGDLDEDGGSGSYESGRSGIKVYATSSGTYYHAKQSCAGSGAVKITLETALNYGKKACQDCCALADRKVYAVSGSFYYHASKDCAGDNAVSGTYAKALAYGLKACPNCIGGNSGSSGSSGDAPEYTAPAESSVFIDLYGDSFYYHKASKCSDSGVSGATEVTLEYAKDFGYERCPHCNPASDVA